MCLCCGGLLLMDVRSDGPQLMARDERVVQIFSEELLRLFDSSLR
jgi:hypothetical protein